MAEADDQKTPGEVEGSSSMSTSEMLIKLLREKMSLSDSKNVERVLDDVTFDEVVRYMLSSKCKKVITMAGAGISTSAGIPDFRSPGTGLYDNLAQYNLPDPQAIFAIDYFKEHPEPFFTLAKNLYPGLFKPTPCHYFLTLLQQKGLLLRHYTQNIDTLERVAGLEDEKLVEAHGTFHTSHCLACHAVYDRAWMKHEIFADRVPHCTKPDCGGIIKPDIVFFGEALPQKFFACVEKDFKDVDLLIIMGTSLLVQPFASLVGRVPDKTVRLYINLSDTASAQADDPIAALFGTSSGLRFGQPNNYRDVFWKGTCDDGCMALAEKLGWKAELQKLIDREHAHIDAEAARAGGATDKSTPTKKAAGSPSKEPASAPGKNKSSPAKKSPPAGKTSPATPKKSPTAAKKSTSDKTSAKM